MKLTRGDRRWISIFMTATAVMILCFALRSTGMVPLDRLPYEPPAISSAGGAGLVDVNAAGLEELMALPGIGEVRAQAILDDREANGPYRYPEDLIRVKGIGEGVLDGILDQITTGGDADAQDPGSRR